MHIELAFVATNQRASVTITTNGVLVGPVASAQLSTNFTAFNLDTFALASYSDAGQGPFMPGSVLAHGIVENIVLKTPPSPVQDFMGAFENGLWSVSFLSLPGWSYSLETSDDLRQWSIGSNRIPGTGAQLKISPPGSPAGARFFRLNAIAQD